MTNSKKLPPGIRIQRSGRYQVRYTGPDGRRYSAGTYRTKTDAQRALANIQASISNRTWRETRPRIDEDALSSNSRLSEWSEEWIATRSSKDGEPLSSMTKKYYRGLIKAGLSSFDRPIGTITANQVRKWWSTYRLEYPRAANSCYKYLKSLLTEAVRRGAIYENPCDIPGATAYVAKPKSQMVARDTVDELIANSDDPWKTFFAVVIFGGLRRGEVAELRVKDVVRDDSRPEAIAIEVGRSVKWLSNSETEVGMPKSASGVRRIWFGPTPTKIIQEYLLTRPQDQEALLFPRGQSDNLHLRESSIRNQIKKARKDYGFTESLHKLRDFSLTLFAQQGATLQEIMARGGHSNVQAAMAYQRDAGRDADLAAGMG